MKLYIDILKGILEKEDITVIFPNWNGINIKDICEMQCYKTLAEMKSVIEDNTLEDKECFWKIEKIISIFEQLGSDGRTRHDF